MKKSILACALGLTLLGSSCLGPNKWFNAVHDWNTKATDSKWGNEAIFFFVGSWVGSIALWGDYVISNSIEFWSGDAAPDAKAK
jgi:hypothetical protein